jgi:hypothetical protein
MGSVALVGDLLDGELDATDSQAIAVCELFRIDPRVVDIGAVCTREILDVQGLVRSRNPAVKARDEGRLQPEVRQRGSAHGFRRAIGQTEQQRPVLVRASKNPHGDILVRANFSRGVLVRVSV